jgi:hypothetical protein
MTIVATTIAFRIFRKNLASINLLYILDIYIWPVILFFIIAIDISRT